MGADFKFIHCADLHLGSRFAGMKGQDPNMAGRMTESVFESFRRIVDLAISEKADMMVIAGDVFDEQNETPNTRYRFCKELERCGIPCYIALGNHDFKRSWEDSIPYPANVHVFSVRPEKLIANVNGSEISIAGRSFASRHMSEDLASTLDGSPDMFSIGVVHCSLDDSKDNRNYAPCRSTILLNKDIDYWALGHIHKRSVENEYPHIVYPGNIQGRNSKETGEKGAYVVTVANGRVRDLKFVPTQSVLWIDANVNIDGCDINGFINSLRKQTKPGSFVNITVSGSGELDRALRLHTAETEEMILKNTGCTVSSWNLRCSPPLDMEKLAGEKGILSEVIRYCDNFALKERTEIIDAICSTKMSAEIRKVLENMTDDELASLVNDSKMLLLERMTEASE